jgi:hypothetical protein
MAWETRKRGGSYYTRSRRVNGRVVREYVGGGALGEIAAMLDEEERTECADRREALKAEHSQARIVADLIADLDALTRQAVAGVLHADGFHRHHGQWRREHGS